MSIFLGEGYRNMYSMMWPSLNRIYTLPRARAGDEGSVAGMLRLDRRQR